MTRGRKPKADAIRRVGDPDVSIIEPSGNVLAMPASLSTLPHAEECWHCIADGQTRFTAKEIPLLEAYCTHYAIAQQARENMVGSDGRIATVVATTSGMTRNPDIRTYADSVDAMRKLSGVLGLDTLTEARLNLTTATTENLAAEIPGKIFATMRKMKDA